MRWCDFETRKETLFTCMISIDNVIPLLNQSTIVGETSILASFLDDLLFLLTVLLLRAAMYQVEPTIIEQGQYASKATPQYEFHKGMKEFADKGREVTKQKLYENLLGMDAVRMVEPHNLKKELCVNTLTYLMFLKQKRTRKVKARGCANRRPQQHFIGKEEASSPSVSI